jgi:phytoene/squalene synthetase
MREEAAFAACAAMVRQADPDRYFSALFAPAAKRPFLFALSAFNVDLARIAASVREPMMGEIRLQWWRETLEGSRSGQPRANDVARALAETLTQTALPANIFDAMIDARAFDFLEGTFSDNQKRDTYVDATSANLMRLAARMLGAGNRFDDLAHEAGLAYGLAGLLRNQATANSRAALERSDVDIALSDAKEHLARARRLKKPGEAIAAFLPATLVPLYLRNPAKDVAIHRRQIALLSASLRGRI